MDFVDLYLPGSAFTISVFIDAQTLCSISLRHFHVSSLPFLPSQLIEAIDRAVKLGLVVTDDKVVGVHALGKRSVMKVLDVH